MQGPERTAVRPAVRHHARTAARGVLLALGVLIALGPAGAAPAAGCAGSVHDRSFLGFACRDAGCSAHKAGFAWADREGVDDAADCTGTDDPAFEEGCRAFAARPATAEQSGFQWAVQNGLAEDCECAGAGPRFAAGCEAFVRGFGR